GIRDPEMSRGLGDVYKRQTLLYSAKNTTQNHALVLADWLRSL
ncbi:DUF488 domain-containing protein, partial [Escherichia coli]